MYFHALISGVVCALQCSFSLFWGGLLSQTLPPLACFFAPAPPARNPSPQVLNRQFAAVAARHAIGEPGIYPPSALASQGSLPAIMKSLQQHSPAPISNRHAVFLPLLASIAPHTSRPRKASAVRSANATKPKGKHNRSKHRRGGRTFHVTSPSASTALRATLKNWRKVMLHAW